jgi:molecular chaperone IbpA
MTSGYPHELPKKYIKDDWGQYENVPKIKSTYTDPFAVLNPFLSSWTVGFSPFFNELQSLRNNQKAVSYPPYNIVDEGDGEYRIEVAVAGFSKSEVNVVKEKTTLTVSGTKEEQTDEKTLHKGIATRDFEQKFMLAEDIEVDKVKLVDGLLVISMHREIPEQDKPITFKVG